DLYLFCEHLRPTLQRLLGGVSDAEARERLKSFTMKGVAQNITCPTLITHGASDRLMNVDGARRLFAEIASTDKTLKIYEEAQGGGTIHCSHDLWATNVLFMLYWLQERL
ncbi:MAG: alpha/beta hydrolase, partial [Deltaproteobacteria bacterium]|nr:alpha/beta hydrolase [Deltaproteobacteria bacterium]